MIALQMGVLGWISMSASVHLQSFVLSTPHVLAGVCFFVTDGRHPGLKLALLEPFCPTAMTASPCSSTTGDPEGPPEARPLPGPLVCQ
jgi:hypothetical protein